MHIPIILDFIGFFELLLRFAHFVGLINKYVIVAIALAINIGGLIAIVGGTWEVLRFLHRKVTGKPAPPCN